MRHSPTMSLPLEARELADEIRRLFDEIDRAAGRTLPGPTGESSPTLDVVETDEAIEVIVDLPGVGGEWLRVVLLGGVLVIVGDKTQPGASQPNGSMFHLVERGFGRFARAIHLSAAIDGSRATAILKDGELRVVVPKIADRRGHELRIPIKDGM
jgi:HSP20 family protein